MNQTPSKNGKTVELNEHAPGCPPGEFTEKNTNTGRSPHFSPLFLPFPPIPFSLFPVDSILLVVYLLIALVFSFLCSVFEAVLLSVRRPYLATQREARPANAATWEKLLDDINRPLSAILILNTVAHTVGAAGVGRKR